MKEVQIHPHQNVPALFTMEGRQYELKNICKRVVIDPADPVPLAPFIPGITFGEPDGSIVPLEENPFNIFVLPVKAIIPLKYIINLIDQNGNSFINISSFFYTWMSWIPTRQINLIKTTQAQSKIQYLTNTTFQPPTGLNSDFKLRKEDFVKFENPERIIWTGVDVGTVTEFINGVNNSSWNQSNPLAPGFQYFANQSFSYFELM